MNYNTDLAIWENLRKSNPGMTVVLSGGHIIKERMETIARFPDDKSARETLEKAGWKEIAPETFIFSTGFSIGENPTIEIIE